jgi:hypothetical protein
LVIENMITRVADASRSIVATLHYGTPPTPNGRPQATVSGFAAILNGGSAQQTVSASPQFNSAIGASDWQPSSHGRPRFGRAGARRWNVADVQRPIGNTQSVNSFQWQLFVPQPV